MMGYSLYRDVSTIEEDGIAFLIIGLGNYLLNGYDFISETFYCAGTACLLAHHTHQHIRSYNASRKKNFEDLEEKVN